MSSRDQTQEKAFLRWANIVLTKHPQEQIPIDDLVTSIQDGITLGRLAEAVIPTTLKLRLPIKNDLTRVQNLTLALESFEKDGCKLINIHSTAVSRGDKKTILGLLFQLCIHYQVQSKDKDENGKQVSITQLKQQIIDWINQQLELLIPEDNLAIRVSSEIYSEKPLICTDLDKSFHDGTLLMGLVAALSIPYSTPIIRQMNQDIDTLLTTKPTNTTHPLFQRLEGKTLTPDQRRQIIITYVGIHTAEKLLEIPPLMDAEDMVLNGDSNANLAYLSYFFNFSLDINKLKLDSLRTSTKKDVEILQEFDKVPEIPPNVVTLATFDPQKEYDDDVILYL